jgi:hypothetical protein
MTLRADWYVFAGVASLAIGCGAEPVRRPVCPTNPAAGPVASGTSSRSAHCSTDAFDGCRAECEAGDAAACSRVGLSLLLGDAKPIDVAGAKAAFERACALGDAFGCYSRGKLADRGAADDGGAADWFDRGCQRSHAESCAALAVNLPEADAATTAKVRAALDRACGLGHLESCAALASRADTKASEALPLLERACVAKNPRACARLGERLESGKDVAADPARARTILAVACEGGESGSCALLGQLLLTTRGGERDPTNARGRLERACADDQVASCRELAQLLRAGDGGAKDTVRALEIYDSACAQGDAAACRAAGEIVSAGDGVKKDPAVAADYKRRACVAEGGKGCGGVSSAASKPAAVPSTREAIASKRLEGLENKCADLLRKKLSKAMSFKEAGRAIVEVLKQARVEIEIVSGGSLVKRNELLKHVTMKCGGA